MSSKGKAYATLLTRTTYLPGVLVLEYGLRSAGSKYPLVVMVTPALPEEAKDILRKRSITVVEVLSLQPREGSHTLAAHDARFADAWTKLRAFELIDYELIVLLDADMLIRKNMDDLMDLELPGDQIAAAHVCACNPHKLKHYPADWIPENCPHTAVSNPTALPPSPVDPGPRPWGQLNSGTVVLHPSKELSEAVYHFLETTDKIAEFSFPDQDLLTAFFQGKWKALPWYYNALRTLRVIHKPEWSDDEVRCVHYILAQKPWSARVPNSETEGEFDVVNRWWWEQFEKVGEEMQATNPEGWKLVSANVAKAE